MFFLKCDCVVMDANLTRRSRSGGMNLSRIYMHTLKLVHRYSWILTPNGEQLSMGERGRRHFLTALVALGTFPLDQYV